MPKVYRRGDERPLPYGTHRSRAEARDKVVKRISTNEWSVRGQESHHVTLSQGQYTCDCRGFPTAKNGQCAHILAVRMFEGEIE